MTQHRRSNFPSVRRFQRWLMDLRKRGLHPGTTWSCTTCPVANFLNEVQPCEPKESWRVGHGWARSQYGVWLLPPWAMRFVAQVDSSGPRREVSAEYCLGVLDDLGVNNKRKELL